MMEANKFHPATREKKCLHFHSANRIKDLGSDLQKFQATGVKE